MGPACMDWCPVRVISAVCHRYHHHLNLALARMAAGDWACLVKLRFPPTRQKCIPRLLPMTQVWFSRSISFTPLRGLLMPSPGAPESECCSAGIRQSHRSTPLSESKCLTVPHRAGTRGTKTYMPGMTLRLTILLQPLSWPTF